MTLLLGYPSFLSASAANNFRRPIIKVGTTSWPTIKVGTTLAVGADAFIAEVAEIRLLGVDVEDRVAQVHRATCVVAMFERKRVSQRMHALFERPLEEDIIARRFFGELGIESVRGDNGHAIAIACVAENERMRCLVQIARQDAEEKPIAPGIRIEHPVEHGVEKELAAGEVGVSGREGERLFDCELVEESLFQTGR
jgi:hypothetical protein